jgi:uncharacterized protein YndB with AHSA1/START domain
MSSRLRNTELESLPAALRMRHAFQAPRALVYLAWTDCVHLTHWWGPPGLAPPDCDLDPRPGGGLVIVLRGPDGQAYPTRGEYREVVPNARLVMTQDWAGHPDDWQRTLEGLHEAPGPAPRSAVLTLEFHEDDGRTTLDWRMDFASDAQRDAMLAMGLAEGWTQSFERLEAYLKTLSSTS